jgi:hypothetical protein
LPDAETPDDSVRAPETPLEDTPALARVTEPEPELLLSPLEMPTPPPVPANEAPEDRYSTPPTPDVPEPTSTDTLPPRPLVDVPVPTDTHPLLPDTL